METSLVERALDLLAIDKPLGQRSGAVRACVLRDVVTAANAKDGECDATRFDAHGSVAVNIDSIAQHRELRGIRHGSAG